jgi:hypothetical protein
MPCLICNTGANTGVCPSCLENICDKAKNLAPEVKDNAVKFVKTGEASWLSGRVQYSDEAQRGFAQHNGQASGFTVKGKNFTLMPNAKASLAVRNFINPNEGTPTICECKSFMTAVYYNAVCEALEEIHRGLFDIVFNNLELVAGKGTDESYLEHLFIIRNVLDESNVTLGDWFYTVSPSEKQTEVHAVEGLGKTNKAGAAGGWNLVCVNVTGTKQYIGLGLSNKELGKVNSLTLDEILEFLWNTGEEKKTGEDKKLKRRGSTGEYESKGNKSDKRALALQRKPFRLYKFSGARLSAFIRKQVEAFNKLQIGSVSNWTGRKCFAWSLDPIQ